MCHPSDGEAWKHFDRMYPDYAIEPRNVRLGLCADGFMLFSISATPYSCWPVFITPYNISPKMCMTSPYIFLNCVIPGPRNPKSLIDLYLQPLIDELKQLWLDVGGGPKRGIAYGLSERSLQRYMDGLQGIGASVQGEAIDRSTISSIEKKIAKLTAELKEIKAREQKRDRQFHTLQVHLEKRDQQFNLFQGQLANLLASGAFPIPRSREPFLDANPSRYDPSNHADDEASSSKDGGDDSLMVCIAKQSIELVNI